MKKIIISLFCLIILCGCGDKKVEKEYEDINANTKENIIKDQKVGDLEFTNTSMIEKDGINTLTTTIINNSNETKNIQTFKILIKDREGNVVDELLAYVGDDIKPNESKLVTTSITSKLSSAYSIEYKLDQE